MSFRPFDVTAPHLMYTILGAFTVLFGMFSLLVKEKLYLGEAPIATVCGIILGPYVLDLFDPYKWGGGQQHVTDVITLELTRVVIAIGVFAIGVELPKAYMKRHWRTMFFLLGPCMVYGWLVSGLLIWGMIPGLTYLSSLVIAACITPTDPILAQAVVGGKFADKHVPTHIRHMLSAESGSNDGAAFPFLYIALYLTLDKSAGHAVGEWFYMTWLYEVALGIVLGGLLGWGARKTMQFSERKKLVDRQSFVAQYVSLAVLSIGICTLLGSDDLLAAFACGCAFAWDGHFNKATEDAVFSNVIDLLFNCACFIYVGAIIPFDAWSDAAINLSVWRVIVLAILILLFRRMPVILALYKWIPDIKTFREAAFVGWFGPMGVGAVFISTLARHHIPEPVNDGDTSQVDLLQETIVPIVMMLVLASILTHGLSIPFFLSGRRVHSITYTWSRNPSMDTRSGNEPAWTTHTRRVVPGQDFVINRDDEEGDIGVVQSNPLSLNREKSIVIDDGSGGSSSSRTRDELNEKASDEGGHQHPRTPPLAAYREGHDLVIERRTDGQEVDVEVVRGAFDREEEPIAAAVGRRRSDSTSSAHSHSTNRSGHSDHSTNAGSDNEDVGDGFVRRRTRPYQQNREPSPVPRLETTTSTSSAPAIHSFIPASRIGKKQEDKSGSGWRRILGRVATTSSGASSHAEQGRAGEFDDEKDTGFLSARTRTNRSMARAATLEPAHDDRGLHLTRTLSRAISFHPDAAQSSGTAPGPGGGNYGAGAPGFKKNLGLSMFRTTSIKQDDEDDGGPSVTFKDA